MRLVVGVVVAGLVFVSGCDRVFGLDHATAQVCDPLPYDQARYWSPTGRLFGLRWSGTLGAREECATRAMDLAVFDDGDTAELAFQAGGAEAPFWLGVSHDGVGWASIDRCPPLLAWAEGEPSVEAPGSCVVMTSTGMAVRPCGHTPEMLGEHIQALCETPRPDERCLARDANSRYAIASTASVTHDAAAVLCVAQGMHLLEINSTAELDKIRFEVAPGLPTFWVEATVGDATITSASGCPLVFSWDAGEPDRSSYKFSCVVYEAAGARAVECDGSVAGAAICEAND